MPIPGLVVLMPATVEDAYTVLLDAVALDDPVVFCGASSAITTSRPRLCRPRALPVGKARIARAGTPPPPVAAASAMLHEALKAADQLAEEDLGH